MKLSHKFGREGRRSRLESALRLRVSDLGSDLLLERKELIVGRKEVQLDPDGREGRNQWDESEESEGSEESATRRNHLAKDLNDREEA
jgi:hypothetical protein